MCQRRSAMRVLALAMPLVAGCAVTPPSGDHVTNADTEARHQGLVPVHTVEPEYPEMAAKADIEGCVTVAFDVRRDGLTDNFQVIDSKPKQAFDHAALLALGEWRFPPREEPVRMTQRLVFARGGGYDPGSPECLAGRDVPQKLLEPGEGVTETGHPTRLRQEQQFEIPHHARQRGIEGGCVTVAFDVLRDGSTANIEVVDSAPGKLFDRAVVSHVRKWRYARREETARIAERVSFGTFSTRDPAEFERQLREIESRCTPGDEVPERYLKVQR